MAKVVYNGCRGGFGLSYAGVQRYAELAGIKLYGFVNERKPSGGISFEKYIPVNPSEADEAFCIHWRTTPSMDEGRDNYWSDDEISRTDPHLIQVVEELGDKAGGRCASLKIAELPTGTQYRIEEYDGLEWVRSRDDYKWETA